MEAQISLLNGFEMAGKQIEQHHSYQIKSANQKILASKTPKWQYFPECLI